MARDLVEHDEGWFIADQFLQQPGAGCRAVLIAAGSESIPCCAGQLIGQFAPQGIRRHIPLIEMLKAIAGLQVRPDDTDDSHHSRGGDQGCINERKSGCVTSGCMVEADQAVGLAASESRLQANDRVVGCLRTCQPAQGLVEQEPQPFGGVGVVEERFGILVNRISLTFNDVFETGSEDLLSQLPLQDFGPWFTIVKDCLHFSLLKRFDCNNAPAYA